MRLGLRVQLLLGLTLGTLAVMVSAGWFALVLADRGMADVHEDQVARSAAALAEGAIPPGGTLRDAAARLQQTAGELRRAFAVRELLFADEGRRVVAVARAEARGHDEAQARSTTLSEPAAALALRSGTRVRSPTDEPALIYEPIRDEGRTVGIVRVAMAGQPAEADALARARRLLFWLSLVDGVVLLLAGAFILGRYVVRPVEALSRAARRVAQGDLGHVVPEQGAGEITDLCCSFNQMSVALREQREQIVRSEKLASVGRLAAGVAHEVGNPLAAVLGYAEILAAGRATPDDVADQANRIRAETTRIHRILQELLEYSRPPREETGPVEIGPLLDVALSLLAPQPRMRAVVVERDLSPDLPPAAGSSGRVTQVLVNLLLNAADAMQGAGRVTVGARARADRIEIRVADSGPGVAPEVRPRLFEPFFTTKDPGLGIGLGLAVCQSIVEAMGGTIRLDEQARSGATFVVTLPVWRG
jgi:two-component system, NtrC family, sensor kinase